MSIMDDDEVPADKDFEKLCNELMGMEYRARYSEDAVADIIEDLNKLLGVLGDTREEEGYLVAHAISEIEDILSRHDPERLADEAERQAEMRLP